MRPNTCQTRGASPTDNSIIKRFAKVIREDRNDIDAKHSLRSLISNLKSLHNAVVRAPAPSLHAPSSIRPLRKSDLKFEIRDPKALREDRCEQFSARYRSQRRCRAP